jgi:short chain dehydrogenase
MLRPRAFAARLIAALAGHPMLGAYTASKFAVADLSEPLHHELAAAGSPVRVSVFCPGPVQTSIRDSERNRPAHVPPASPRPGTTESRPAAADTIPSEMPATQAAVAVLRGIRDEPPGCSTTPTPPDRITPPTPRNRADWRKPACPPYKAAAEHYALSVAARRPAERWTRALIGAELARIQVVQRQPGQAAQTLLGLRDDLTAVSSRRLARALAQVRTAWRPYRPDPAIDDADRLLAGLARPS